MYLPGEIQFALQSHWDSDDVDVVAEVTLLAGRGDAHADVKCVQVVRPVDEVEAHEQDEGVAVLHGLLHVTPQHARVVVAVRRLRQTRHLRRAGQHAQSAEADAVWERKAQHRLIRGLPSVTEVDFDIKRRRVVHNQVVVAPRELGFGVNKQRRLTNIVRPTIFGEFCLM